MFDNFDLRQILIGIPPMLLAITIHEFSHGWVALRFGDPTAKIAGRLTLNPLSHFDLIGSLMLVLIHFGWAKPVPVNPYLLRNPKRDMALVAAAGPISNIAAATLSALLLRVFLMVNVPYFLLPIGSMLVVSIMINCGLALFNIIPIHPLDGSKILAGILPYPYSEQFARLEPYGFFILLVFVLTPAIDIIKYPFYVLLKIFSIIVGVPII